MWLRMVLAVATACVVGAGSLAGTGWAATISGTVVDEAAGPVAGGYIAVYAADGGTGSGPADGGSAPVPDGPAPAPGEPAPSPGEPAPEGDVPVYAGGTSIGLDGRYTVTGLPAGRFKVRFMAPFGGTLASQFYADKRTAAAADVVELTSSSSAATGIDAILYPGNEIRGTVTGGGHPLAGVQVNAYDADGQAEGFVRTDVDGTYRLTGLTDGDYRVGFHTDNGLNYVGAYNGGAARLAEADPLSVAGGGATSGIDAELRVGGRILGRVTDAETGEAVQAIVDTSDGDGYSAWAMTDASGNFVVAGLPTDEHTVSFTSYTFSWSQNPTYRVQYYDGTTDPEAADPVAVVEGSDVTGIDAVLDPAGRIRGTVTDDAGHPIVGVQVSAYDADDDVLRLTAATDAAGRYRITGLDSGTYKLAFREPSGVYVTEYYDDADSLGSADPVTVVDGETTSGIDASLASTGRIEGTVRDEETGAVIANALVSVYDNLGAWVTSAFTDAAGHYVVGGLDGGSYRVMFNASSDGTPAPPPLPSSTSTIPVGANGADYVPEFYDNKTSLTSATRITVVDRQATTGIDAELRYGGRIEGDVVEDAGGAPIAGGTVAAFDAYGSLLGWATVDPQGHYVVRGLATGSYRIRYDGPPGGGYVQQFHNGKATLSTADPVAVTVGRTTTVATARLEAGGSISGRVQVDGSGAPVTGGYVSVNEPDAGTWITVPVGPDGWYTVGGLRPGSYQLWFGGDGVVGEYFDDKTYLDPDRVTVGRGQHVTGIDSSLAPSAAVTGTVRDATTGDPVAGVRVWVETATGMYPGTTGSDGTYRVAGLPSGDCRVSFEAPQLGYPRRYYEDAETYATATPIALGAGQTAGGIDMRLTKGGSIVGTVTAADDGSPVADMNVVIHEADTGSYVLSTQTDEAGRYVAPGLPDGDYLVEFSSSGALNYVGVYYDGRSAAQADRVTVAKGTETTVDQAVATGGRVVGVVRADDDGSAVANAWVTVSATIDGVWFSHDAQTDEDGRYSVGGLPTGTFSVYVSPPSDGFLVSANVGGAIPVTAGQDTTMAEVRLAVGGRIAGNVRDLDDDTPLYGTAVNVYTPSGSWMGNGYSSFDGSYSIGPLAPGTYKLRFSGGDGKAYGSQYYDAKTSLAEATAVTVTRRVLTGGIDAGMTTPPVSTTPPSISGTPKQGQTLSATAGVWAGGPTSVTRQWLRCYTDASCSDIGGATGATYTLGAADGGYRIAVRETAVNLGGSTTARSALSDVIVPLPPINNSAPSVYGLARSGEQLSVTVGSWTNNPTGYRYQWRRCNALGSACVDLVGQTAYSYTVTDADIGSRLVVAVTAVNAGGESEPVVSSGSSVVVRAVPSNLTAPTISGAAKQGETLTAAPGQWSGEPTGYSYTWQRCDAAGGNCVSTGYSSTYAPRAADVGKTIVVAVNAYNDGGSSLTAVSAPTEIIVATRPANVTPPWISGTARVGQTLYGNVGFWANEPTGYEYAWLACPEDGDCEPIPGATTTSLVLGEAQIGTTIVFQVTAANPAGQGAAATSSATAVVQPLVPTVISRPTISGTPIVGQTLTSDHGTWTNAPTGYEQQWYRCVSSGSCSAISGAVDQTYTLVADDEGRRIVVRVRAVNASGAGAWASSDETGSVVMSAPVNVTAPSIGGTAREGQTLTVQRGTWTNAPTDYDYQWLSCSSADSCTPIVGVTGSQYTVRYADVDRRIAVAVTATNAGGTGGPVRSALSAPVVAGDPPETVLLWAPAPYVSDGTQTVSFVAVPSDAPVECRLGDDPFVACSSPQQFAGLAEGAYRFEARAKDAQGRIDPSPLVVEWTVDRTPPETEITAGPEHPVHGTAAFTFTSTEPDGSYECAFDSQAYKACRSGDPLDLKGLSPGEHSLRVRATDRAGNTDPSGATRTFSFANATPSASLTVTPDAGMADLEVAASVAGADADVGDDLDFKLDFGDGHVVSGGLPRAPVSHTYDKAGIYLARLEVTDGHETDVVTRPVTVVLAEPLRADAGDDLVAVAGETVTLDGRGSRPAAGIESAEWTFGDGQSGHTALTNHVYATPGVYTARLTVAAGGGNESDTAQVRVVSASEAQGLGVTVSSGGGPVANADVLVITADGRRISGSTDPAGRTRLHGLADGDYTVLTYADGYKPTSTAAAVRDASGAVAVNLVPGNVAEASLTHRRLSRNEIVGLGIDPDDPDNQIVSEFTVNLNGGTFKGWINGRGLGGSGCSGQRCTFSSGGSTTYLSYHNLGGTPGVSTFTLPFTARWLKEFFEVKLTVYNLGTPDFVLRGGHARLTIPDGVSLAPTARGEQAAKPVGDIVGGSSASVDWIVRGDRAGEYDLAADYAATLDPVGRSVSVRASTDAPLKVWGADAIETVIETDKQYRDGYPMTVRVGLKNVSDIPVYDAQVELGDDGAHGYITQPRQQRAFGARQIAAGQTTWLGPWVIVPRTSGELNVGRSFVKQIRGDALGAFRIVARDRNPTLDAAPRLTPSPLGEDIKLDWEPVPGATSYQVYELSDRDSPFDDDPIRVDSLDDVTEGSVPRPEDGEERYYAVSSIVNGRPTMVHPLVKAPAVPSVGDGGIDPLGAPKATCGLTSVKVGAAEFVASCFTRSGDVYTANGRVRVNGIDLMPNAARVTIDVAKAKVSVDNLSLKLGSVLLYQGKFEWSPRLSKTFSLAPNAKVGKLPITGEMELSVAPDRADLTAKVAFPAGFNAVKGTLRLGATTKDGPKLDRFEISAGGLKVGRLGIDDVSLKYKSTPAGAEWAGGATIAIPRPISPLRIGGEVVLLNGKFKSASVSAEDINQLIAYGVFLQRLHGGIQIDPLGLTGGIGLSAGPSINRVSLLSVYGEAKIVLSDPQEYSIKGEIKVLDATLQSGYVRYRTDGFLEFGGEMGFEKGQFKAKASMDGWVDGTKAANATGRGEFSVPGASFSAEGVLSSVGIAACRHGFGPDVGAGYRWASKDLTIFASSCDIGPYEATRPSAHRAAGAPDGFAVAAGEPVEVLAFRGRGGTPQVVLHGPNGERIAAPNGGQGISRADLMLIQQPEDQTTYVAIFTPTAGEWTVDTASGSAPVTRIERAGTLPEPQVAATVDQSGGRAILRWRLRPLAGQRVRFVERSADGARVIATTDDATGSAEFDPLPDDNLQRRIEAVVEQDGLTRRTVAVEKFEADPALIVTPAPPVTTGPAGAAAGPTTLPGTTPSPAGGSSPAGTVPRPARRRAPVRPSRPARVRLVRRRGTVVVTWSAGRGATRYAVRSVVRGRATTVVRRHRRLVVGGVRRGDRIRVSVRAIGAHGARSAARTATRIGSGR